MRREWEPEELIAAWTLLDGDWDLVGNKTGATRLGFSLLLKFFEQEGRFPRHVGELPKAAVDYMAGQVKVDPALLAEYDWSGWSIERHRAQVREALGFRESTRADEDVLADWLADKICPMVFTDEGLRAALLARRPGGSGLGECGRRPRPGGSGRAPAAGGRGRAYAGARRHRRGRSPRGPGAPRRRSGGRRGTGRRRADCPGDRRLRRPGELDPVRRSRADGPNRRGGRAHPGPSPRGHRSRRAGAPAGDRCIGIARHAVLLDGLAERHGRPLVSVFTTWYRALRRAEDPEVPFAAKEAAYRAAAVPVDSAGMPGLGEGLPPLALQALRVRHDRAPEPEDPDRLGPYRPWALPVLLAAGRRDEAAEALRAVPDPPHDLLAEALWALLARATLSLGDPLVLRRAHAALFPAAGEQAGAASGLISLGPVSAILAEITAVPDL